MAWPLLGGLKLIAVFLHGCCREDVDRRSEGEANALAGAVVQLPKTRASKATAVDEGDANALAGAVVQLPKTRASKATAVALQMLVPDPETVLVPAIVASSHPFLITLGAPRPASAAGLGIGSADTTSSAAAEQPAYTRAANKRPPAAGPATNSTNRKRSAAAAQSPCSTAAKPTTPAAANSIGSADGKRSAAAAQPPYSTATNPTAPPAANSIGSADGKRSSAAEQLPYSTAAKPPAPAAKLDMGSNGKRIPETEYGGKRAKSSAPPKQLSRPAKKSTPSSVGGRASGLAHTDIAASPAVIALASASAAPPAVIASGSASAVLAAVIASGNASAAPRPVRSGKLLAADPRNAWQAAGVCVGVWGLCVCVGGVCFVQQRRTPCTMELHKRVDCTCPGHAHSCQSAPHHMCTIRVCVCVCMCVCVGGCMGNVFRATELPAEHPVSA